MDASLLLEVKQLLLCVVNEPAQECTCKFPCAGNMVALAYNSKGIGIWG